MADPVDSGPDPHDLGRFVNAQAGEYEQAAQSLQRAHDFYRTRKLRLVLWALRASPRVDWRLFEFSVEVAMVRRHGPAEMKCMPVRWSIRITSLSGAPLR